MGTGERYDEQSKLLYGDCVESSSQNGSEERNYSVEYIGANTPFDKYSTVDGSLDESVGNVWEIGSGIKRLHRRPRPIRRRNKARRKASRAYQILVLYVYIYMYRQVILLFNVRNL